MALRWDFNEPGGTITFKNGDVYSWYEGNCLVICLNEFTDEDGIGHYSLQFFFADLEHMKNCCGLTKGHENIFSDNPITEMVINKSNVYQWVKLVNWMSKAFPDMTFIIK